MIRKKKKPETADGKMVSEAIPSNFKKWGSWADSVTTTATTTTATTTGGSTTGTYVPYTGSSSGTFKGSYSWTYPFGMPPAPPELAEVDAAINAAHAYGSPVLLLGPKLWHELRNYLLSTSSARYFSFTSYSIPALTFNGAEVSPMYHWPDRLWVVAWR